MDDRLRVFDDATDRFYSGAMSAGEYKGISGGMGSYAQRDGKAGMVRLRLAGGRITREKLEFVCGCIEEYRPDMVHCTTCQSLQLHGLGPEAVKAIVAEAPTHGIITFGGGGDYPRNVTATPLAGLIASSRLDVVPYAQAAEEYLRGLALQHRLPRKLKVGFTCTEENIADATMRDLGFVAEADGTFTVYSGGGMGSNPRLGLKVAESVDPEDFLVYADAMFRMFLAHGNYTDRSRARVRYMRDALGDEGYVREFVRFVESSKADAGIPRIRPASVAPSKRGDGSVPSTPRARPQCQEGLFYIAYHPIGGDPSPSKMLELRDALRGMEGAEIRISPNETVYIVNLTGSEADRIARIASDGAASVFSSSVSCVGSSVCQMGLRDSRSLLDALIAMEAEEGFADRVLPMVRISGCRNSCAAHQVGTIGLCGCGNVCGEPGFTVSVNGSHVLGKERLGTEIGDVPVSLIPDMFRAIGRAVEDSGDGSFRSWTASHPGMLEEVCAQFVRRTRSDGPATMLLSVPRWAVHMSALEDEIRKLALQNAVQFKGTANPKSIVGKILGGHPECRADVPGTTELINKIVGDVNAMSPDAQKAELDSIDPSLAKKEKKVRTYELADLKNVEQGHTVMRIAPGPSGPLHIGHTRVSVLNDEYTKRYDGKLILRFEDTNPEKIDPDAYDMIPEDLDWLGVKIHEKFIQSERFELYYDTTRKLIEQGNAYVCTCDPEDWRKKKEAKIACPCRDLPVNEQLDRYDRMMEGGYEAGKAIAVVKTDIAHPNPAVRDFVALRLVDAPHPLTGDKYRAYPMMNLSVAVDDHYMGMTHVIRGKDHLNNTERQKYIFNYFGWKIPEYHHYGLVNIPDTVLKTSLIKQSIKAGEYSGWDDVRTGTVRALERRGIRPEAIRRYWVESGIKPVDIEFSWDNLYGMNRSIIDPVSHRYFFVENPVRYDIAADSVIAGRAPLLPDSPDAGYREYSIDSPYTVFVNGKDSAAFSKDGRIRLKDLCNLEYGTPAKYAGNDVSDIRKYGMKAVQWVGRDSVPCSVAMPDGTVSEGLVESGVLGEKTGGTVQFERFGFVRIEKNGPDGVKCIYTHD